MNDPYQLTIRVQTYRGVWETLGADRYVGVNPEDVHLEYNANGPDTATFSLKRDPTAISPDLSSWTPVEVEVEGVVVWEGRALETPTSEANVSVSCNGWQYHLDDDVYWTRYIHTKLSSFQDIRSMPTADLSVWLTAPQVSAGDTGLNIVRPGGTLVHGAGTLRNPAGVVFDMGEGNTFEYVAIDWVINQQSGVDIDCSVATTADAIATTLSNGQRITNLATAFGGGLSGTFQYDASTFASRFLVLYTAAGSATDITPTADAFFQVTGIRIFRKKAYQSAGQSILKAGTIVKDALAQGAPLISADVSQIDDGSFAIPEFSPDGYQTANEIIQAVNAYENFEFKITSGVRAYFRPRENRPIYEIGEWSGADFQDASANSGDSLYNRAIIEGTGPDGLPLNVIRTVGGSTWTTDPDVLVADGNSGFATNTTGWTAINGTISRDTGTHHTGTASLKIVNATPASSQFVTTIGDLQMGGTYRLTLWVKRNLSPWSFSVAIIGAGTTNFTVTEANVSSSVFTRLDFVFTADETEMVLRFTTTAAGSGATTGWLDDVYLSVPASSLLDRRGFRRTKILQASSAITRSSAERIGDLFLDANQTIPFKGSFQAVGKGGVRRLLNGGTIHPAHLKIGQMVRCAHRVDPDTGGWGRDGTIASIAYDHSTLTSSVSLDENREGFEALLARLAVVTGQRSA